ncbi:LysR family transcriptional regulator [Agromyces bracchium]|uniref:LysR family transcriptional regulator n=1 Tax=Agromyces bracchium TaxID=88376 RepID=A0A6I3M996_9MICO|nr:LysR substrate-binding domain-containing protein [Agromyces bracchium]MTH70029.1 LysR family transcriptional regulator [Agromyces bracchium]
MFDLRSARYFVAVAEELHFSRAAERLMMSQPPLSQAIRQLEQDVGAVLLERTNRRVALTPAGEAFLVECRALLLHADAVAETPRLVARGSRAVVTIGCVASVMTWPLPQTLALLRERAPHIAVRIRELDTDQARDDLLRGRIDIALSRIASEQAGISTRTLLRDEFCVLLPATHPLADEGGPLDLARLVDDDWVWLPREISRDYHDDMTSVCRAGGISPRARHWVRSIASQIALVGCGVGVTVIPRVSAVDLPRDVRMRQIRDPAEAVVLAASTRSAPEPAERLVVDLIAQVVAARGHPVRAPGPGN